MVVVLGYRENLPGDCPPDTAIRQTKKLYRLIGSFPPSESDFTSQWQERSDKREEWEEIECKAKGLSLFVSPRVALQKAKVRKMTQTQVCEVNITPASGPIEQTNSVHYTWWPLRGCDILGLCSRVEP